MAMSDGASGKTSGCSTTHRLFYHTETVLPHSGCSFKFLTPQLLLELHAKYRQAVENVIAQLTPEQRAQSKLVEAAIRSAIEPRACIELGLSDVRELIRADVGAKLTNELKIDLTANPNAMTEVTQSIAESYSVTVNNYFFTPEGAFEIWTERAVFEHLVSPDTEQLMKERRVELAQMHTNEAQHLANFDAKHAKEMVGKSDALRKERQVLEERREKAKEAQEAADKEGKEAETGRLEKEKRLGDMAEKEEKRYKEWKKGIEKK